MHSWLCDNHSITDIRQLCKGTIFIALVLLNGDCILDSSFWNASNHGLRQDQRTEVLAQRR